VDILKTIIFLNSIKPLKILSKKDINKVFFNRKRILKEAFVIVLLIKKVKRKYKRKIL